MLESCAHLTQNCNHVPGHFAILQAGVCLRRTARLRVTAPCIHRRHLWSWIFVYYHVRLVSTRPWTKSRSYLQSIHIALSCTTLAHSEGILAQPECGNGSLGVQGAQDTIQLTVLRPQERLWRSSVTVLWFVVCRKARRAIFASL